MAETITTIDIATQLKAGIVSALSTAGVAGVTIRADGVRDDTAADDDVLILPAVGIRVAEGMNHSGGAQASKLRDYQVTIQVQTHYRDDPWQINLLTISQAVGKYLLGPATLTLSAGTFLALNLPNAPERADEERTQTMTFAPVVKVHVT